MEGYIITYEPNLTSKQITEINYFLFGKVLSKMNRKYYYPGLLDAIPYNRLGNGCYFIITTNESIINALKTQSTFITIRSELHTDMLSLQTARNSKRNRYNGVYVKNL